MKKAERELRQRRKRKLLKKVGGRWSMGWLLEKAKTIKKIRQREERLAKHKARTEKDGDK